MTLNLELKSEGAIVRMALSIKLHWTLDFLQTVGKHEKILPSGLMALPLRWLAQRFVFLFLEKKIMKKIVLMFLLVLVSHPVFAEHFNVAHLKIDSENLIVIPLGSEDMVRKSTAAKKELHQLFKSCMKNAGLNGAVMLAWPQRGNMAFYGDTGWLSYMKSKNMQWVNKNINRKVRCE